MAFPAVTYSFTNGTAADATQVNQNFTDLINGLSDGTKSLNVAAITAAGNVALGASSAVDVTFNGSLATNILPKTQRTYAIGSGDLGLSGLYLGMNSTHTILLQGPSSGASADYTLTLPPLVGVSGKLLTNTGSATCDWKYPMSGTSSKSADYTVTDSDGIDVILMTTSSTNRTITLPAAANNAGRILTVKKVDSGTGTCILDGNSTETIDGALTFTLYAQYSSIMIQCDGSNWLILNKNLIANSQIVLYTGNGRGSPADRIRRFSTVGTNTGSAMTFTPSATNGDSVTIVYPGYYSMSYVDRTNSGTAQFFGISKNASSLTTDIGSLAAGEILIQNRTGEAGGSSSQGDGPCVSVVALLAVGDVIRAHGDGSQDNTVANFTRFAISHIIAT